jgi:hypothetical protein
VTEEHLDRGVDVEVHQLQLGQFLLPQTVLGHHLFQELDLRGPEATQVAVDRVDAGDGAARHEFEDRVGGEVLQAEDARLAQKVGVDEQPQLGAHRVDDTIADLEVAEAPAQSLVHADVPQKRAEGYEPGGGAQRRIGLADPDAARIGSANPPPLLLQLVAVSPLASSDVSTHLSGARRGHCVVQWHADSTPTSSNRFQAEDDIRQAAPLRGQKVGLSHARELQAEFRKFWPI